MNAIAAEHSRSVLEVHQLRKKIGGKEIIKGISFRVDAGEIFGFLGPNGSGKTTTIRMLVGLIKPTQGTVTICGIDAHKHHNEALRHVGCIVENPELYAYLSGWENLEFFAAMLPDIDRARIDEVVRLVGMELRIYDKVKTYSLGMRQRLGIAQALLGRPKLLILDEPTNGLDPQGIKELRQLIRRLADNGISLFISSHLLSEIQLMCQRVAIINGGQVIAVGDVAKLLYQTQTKVIWDVEPAAQAASLLQAEHVEPLVVGEMRGKISVAMDAARIPVLNARLVQADVKVHAIELAHETLEDLFLRLTGGGAIG